MEVFLVVSLIAPAYFFGPVPSFYIANSVLRVSRFAGATGILASIGLWELIQVAQGREFLSLWTRFHPGSSITAMFLFLGWLIGCNGYFLHAGIWDKPGQQRSDVDLLNLEPV